MVKSIYIGGGDVLRIDDECADAEPTYGRTDAHRLSDLLSLELIVPARLLKVTYTPADTDNLRIARGWTVRKQSASGAKGA